MSSKRKRSSALAHRACLKCQMNSGNEAVCLGCGRTFKPCQDHWPLFTYCSRKCATPHRKALNKILFEPLKAHTEQQMP